AVAAEMGGRAPSSASEPELGYIKDDAGKYHLAYRSIFEGSGAAGEPPYRINSFVDAKDGSVVTSFNEIEGRFGGPQGQKLQQFLANPWSLDGADSAEPTEPGTGRSLYSGIVPLGTTQLPDGGGFVLVDPARNGSTTRDARDAIDGRNAVD